MMERLRREDIKKQLFRYVVTGGSAFLGEYLLYMLLFKVFGIDYAIASVIAFVVFFLVTFVLNRKWTFESTGNAKRQFALYFLLFLFNMLFGNYVLIQWIVGVGIPKEIAPFFKTAAITMWNFVIYRLVIYK